MDRQQEYLRLLQERNRLKKMMNEKSDEELMKEELERGFSTHFRGAHAAKDKNTTNRFENKPTVKVHKSPNNIDLVKRLNPLAAENSEATTNNGNNRSTSRSSARGHSREHFDRSDYASNEAEMSGKEEKPASRLPDFMNSSVDQALFGQLTSMSKDQKRALLQLLQANITESVVEEEERESRGEEEQITKETSETEENTYLMDRLAEDIDLRANTLDGGSKLMIETIRSESVPIAAAPDLRSKFGEIRVNLRIKLSSTWKTSKNVFLQGLRLRSVIDGKRGETIYVDLLHLLSCKVYQGLVPAPSNSETSRLIHNLLGIGLNYKSSLWKSAISLQNSVELAFEGELPLSLFEKYCVSEKEEEGDKEGHGNLIFREAKDILQSIELSLWNGFEEENETNTMINASAAKDVDIFVNDICSWSGEMAFESQKLDIFRAVDEFSSFNKYEAKPTLTMRPYQPKQRPGTTATSKPKESLQSHRSSPSPSNRKEDSAFVKKLFGSPARSKPSTPKLTKSSIDLSSELEKPDWLKFNKEQPPRTILLTPSSKEGRLLDDGSFRSPQRRGVTTTAEETRSQNEHGPAAASSISNSSGLKSPSLTKSESKQKLANRRRRNREVGSFDAEAGVTLSPTRRKTPKTLSEINKELDSTLRKSIEAVEHAEKFNLNRLETTVARNPTKRVSTDPEVSHLQIERADEERTGSTKKVAFLPEEDLAVGDEVKPRGIRSAARGGRRAVKTPLPADFSSSLRTEAVPSETRAAKIEQVNAKITTTLNDLADILAGLPKQPPSEDEEEEAEKNNSREAVIAVETGANYTDSSSLGVESGDVAEKSQKLSVLTTPRVPPSGHIAINHRKGPPLQDLPKGTTLVFEILTTHGDMSYVGLNGLEFFDAEGNNILLERPTDLQSITANPMDLSVLPGYSDDPRKVENLVDGVNNTKDDLHQWLAPHLRVVEDFLKKERSPSSNGEKTSSQPIATITVTFSSPQAFSIIKIFNFNKSRTHNQRGIRDLRILLDDAVIFKGSIKKATGFHTFSSEDDCQLISFTSNQKIMEYVTPLKTEPVDDVLEDSLASPNTRPRTSDSSSPPPPAASAFGSSQSNTMMASNTRARHSTTSLLDEVLYETEELDRPTETAINQQPLQARETVTISSTATTVKRTQFIPDKLSATQRDASATLSPFSCLSAKLVTLELESSWGDQDYLGLNGLEILGADGKPLKLSNQNLVNLSGQDSFSFSGFGTSSSSFASDSRGVENLLNGINNTANDQFMWLIPRDHSKSKHSVQIDLKKTEAIAGIRIWNYNGSTESCLRGCKVVAIYLDKKAYFRCLLRPGPECDGLDFSQTIFFSHLAYEIERAALIPRKIPAYITPKLKQTYETSVAPCGLLWKFTMLSNHGDDYYLGLDHIDFFDADNQIIPIDQISGRVGAVPHSVRDLSSSIADPLFQDPRVPERLFTPTYFTDAQRKPCWLAPLAKCMTQTEREACVNRVVDSLSISEVYSQKKKANVLPRENTLFVMFSYPVTISAIRIFNYSKTMERGVCDYSLHVDGNLVYMGSLVKANEECPVHHSKASLIRSQGQIIVFNNDAKTLNAHKELVAFYNYNEQDVLCINERQVMVRSKTMYDKSGITADVEKRPTTSYFS